MILEKAIGNLLRARGWTLSIAESCTGGSICDRITNIPGSSDYFMGGMVTYSNQSKIKHLGVPKKDIKQYGAVSPQVAKKMAQGVRQTFHTTFGLSTTGIAGPTGGSKEKPVGLVFIAISDGKEAIVKRETFKGDRQDIKKASASCALQYFYDYLRKTQYPGKTNI